MPAWHREVTFVSRPGPPPRGASRDTHRWVPQEALMEDNHMYQPTNRLSKQDLERALTHLETSVSYPPTPDLTIGLHERLASRPAKSSSWWTALWQPRRVAALAILSVLVVAFAALAFSPEARSALADRLGVRGIKIWYMPAESTPSPQDGNTPEPTPVLAPSLSPVGLGRYVSPEEAQGFISYTILKPTVEEVGQPDETFVTIPPDGGQVSFLYRTRQGLPPGDNGVALLLTQFRGDIQEGTVFGKGLPEGVTLEAVTVNGAPGFWISGDLHYFHYRDPKGDIKQERVRLAANTLLWEQGVLTLRLEGHLTAGWYSTLEPAEEGGGYWCTTRSESLRWIPKRWQVRKIDPYSYKMTLSPDGAWLYVEDPPLSNRSGATEAEHKRHWAGSGLRVLEAASGRQIAVLAEGKNALQITLQGNDRLYIAVPGPDASTVPEFQTDYQRQQWYRQERKMVYLMSFEVGSWRQLTLRHGHLDLSVVAALTR